jgi:HEPN domain-containing protein
MSAPKIGPAKIFEQGDCFYQTLVLLRNVASDNMQLATTIGEPAMVIGALTIELFLKCLICIETGNVPRGHDLKGLFDSLGEHPRTRIEDGWTNEIAKDRSTQWDHLETITGVKIARDLPTALTVASRTFERLRYSYEGNTADLQYYLQDLPELLGRIILDMRPEFATARRKPLP